MFNFSDILNLARENSHNNRRNTARNRSDVARSEALSRSVALRAKQAEMQQKEKDRRQQDEQFAASMGFKQDAMRREDRERQESRGWQTQDRATQHNYDTAKLKQAGQQQVDLENTRAETTLEKERLKNQTTLNAQQLKNEGFLKVAERKGEDGLDREIYRAANGMELQRLKNEGAEEVAGINTDAKKYGADRTAATAEANRHLKDAHFQQQQAQQMKIASMQDGTTRSRDAANLAVKNANMKFQKATALARLAANPTSDPAAIEKLTSDLNTIEEIEAPPMSEAFAPPKGAPKSTMPDDEAPRLTGMPEEEFYGGGLGEAEAPTVAKKLGLSKAAPEAPKATGKAAPKKQVGPPRPTPEQNEAGYKAQQQAMQAFDKANPDASPQEVVQAGRDAYKMVTGFDPIISMDETHMATEDGKMVPKSWKNSLTRAIRGGGEHTVYQPLAMVNDMGSQLTGGENQYSDMAQRSEENVRKGGDVLDGIEANAPEAAGRSVEVLATMAGDKLFGWGAGKVMGTQTGKAIGKWVSDKASSMREALSAKNLGKQWGKATTPKGPPTAESYAGMVKPPKAGPIESMKPTVTPEEYAGMVEEMPFQKTSMPEVPTATPATVPGTKVQSFSQALSKGKGFKQPFENEVPLPIDKNPVDPSLAMQDIPPTVRPPMQVPNPTPLPVGQPYIPSPGAPKTLPVADDFMEQLGLRRGTSVPDEAGFKAMLDEGIPNPPNAKPMKDAFGFDDPKMKGTYPKESQFNKSPEELWNQAYDPAHQPGMNLPPMPGQGGQFNPVAKKIFKPTMDHEFADARLGPQVDEATGLPITESGAPPGFWEWALRNKGAKVPKTPDGFISDEAIAMYEQETGLARAMAENAGIDPLDYLRFAKTLPKNPEHIMATFEPYKRFKMLQEQMNANAETSGRKFAEAMGRLYDKSPAAGK